MSKWRQRAQRLIQALSAERIGVQQMEQTIMTALDDATRDEANVWRDALAEIVLEQQEGDTSTARLFRAMVETRVVKIRKRSD